MGGYNESEHFTRESSSKNFVIVYIEPFRQMTKEVHMADDLQDYGGTGLKKRDQGAAWERGRLWNISSS